MSLQRGGRAWLLPLGLCVLFYLALYFVRTQQAWAVFGQRLDLYPVARWLRSLSPNATPDQLRLASYLLLGLISFVYLLAIRMAPRRCEKGKFLSWVVAPYVVLGLTSLIFYPAVSAPLDTVDYTMHARIQLVYGDNPYIARGIDYEGKEPLLQFAEAKQRPSVYGPVALYAGLLPAILGGGTLLASVFAFKILFFLAGLLVLWCVWLFGMSVVPTQGDHTVVSGVVVAWNPVLHLISHGAGHNDILMAVFLAASVVAIGLQKPLWGFVSWTLSFLVKFISAPLAVPLIACTLRRSQTGGGSSGRRLAITGLAVSGLLAIAAFAPYGPTAVLETISSRYGGLVTSGGDSKIGILSGLASGALNRVGMDWGAPSVSTLVGLALPLAWLSFTALRGLNVKDVNGFVRVAVESFLFYITFVSLPVYAQYAVTPLVLAGFLSPKDKWHLAAAIVASLALAWDSLYLVYPSRAYAPWENYLHQLSHVSALLVLFVYWGRRASSSLRQATRATAPLLRNLRRPQPAAPHE